MQQTALAALRMQRQHFTCPANEAEYIALYRDLQPGLNVYWNGFGQPPTLVFRAGFDDLAFNRARQSDRRLIKGRFAGGTLGWIVPEDLELFAGLYRKPLAAPAPAQAQLLGLIRRAGPMNIQQMKEEAGLLVKEITPALHRLQEAFLIYEDQTDGQWDRPWYTFEEIFPHIDAVRYTRVQALQAVLPRFAYRMVWFDTAMAKSFYKLPEKDLKAAIAALCAAGTFTPADGGFVLTTDIDRLAQPAALPASIYALHRNDPLYKAYEPVLKERFAPLRQNLPYDSEPLYYLLINGEFSAVAVGHFRNGPNDLNDVLCTFSPSAGEKEHILAAIQAVTNARLPQRFMGQAL